jgi:hypothetical protein
MVWEVFMERPETWTSGRFEKDGEPIGSHTYFSRERVMTVAERIETS